MKKIKIILSLALLISITCIAGMANKSNRTSQDSLKLRLLEATEHRIQINCPQLNKRVYIIDDLTLLKKDIVNNKVCFFLSSEFTVSDVILVDKDIQLMEYKNAKYYDFNPQIDFELFSSFMWPRYSAILT